MAEYSFVPMTHADLDLFKAWLKNPHIQGWWGDSGTEARLALEDLGDGRVDQRIVYHNGSPFAYIQDYNAHAFGAPQYADQDPNARAIDTFLGDPAYLGKGHGSGYIAARVAELRKSYPAILTDPDPANKRAIAAYASAGFRSLKIALCEDDDPVEVMRCP